MSRASEWKDKAQTAALAEAVELTLPSGAKILARRPGLDWLASQDRMPLGLASAAAGEAAREPSVEEVVKLAGFWRDLLVYVCIEPRVSMTPGEDEIHPQQIPHEDWMFIIRWAQRAEEARTLEGFRGQRADAGSDGDGQGVLDKTF